MAEDTAKVASGGDKPILLVDSVVVQNSVHAGVFYLSLFEYEFAIDPPPREGRAICIGRFAFTPQTMATFIELLQRNFSRFQEAVEQEYNRTVEQESQKAAQSGPEDIKP